MAQSKWDAAIRALDPYAPDDVSIAVGVSIIFTFFAYAFSALGGLGPVWGLVPGLGFAFVVGGTFVGLVVRSSRREHARVVAGLDWVESVTTERFVAALLSSSDRYVLYSVDCWHKVASLCPEAPVVAAMKVCAKNSNFGSSQNLWAFAERGNSYTNVVLVPALTQVIAEVARGGAGGFSFVDAAVGQELYKEAARLGGHVNFSQDAKAAIAKDLCAYGRFDLMRSVRDVVATLSVFVGLVAFGGCWLVGLRAWDPFFGGVSAAALVWICGIFGYRLVRTAHIHETEDLLDFLSTVTGEAAALATVILDPESQVSCLQGWRNLANACPEVELKVAMVQSGLRRNFYAGAQLYASTKSYAPLETGAIVVASLSELSRRNTWGRSEVAEVVHQERYALV